VELDGAMEEDLGLRTITVSMGVWFCFDGCWHCTVKDKACYSQLAVVSDVDDEQVCPECRWRNGARSGLYQSPYNRAEG
jgi:hypothetical protein